MYIGMLECSCRVLFYSHFFVTYDIDALGKSLGGTVGRYVGAELQPVEGEDVGGGG